MRTLAAFDKGYEFPPVPLDLSDAWVASYTAAVGDRAIAALGQDVVPPMALAALSIRSLIQQAGLPEGAVHVGQDLTFHRVVRTGERLTASARIISRGERQGWVLMGVEMSVLGLAGDPVMTGRATVSFPVSGGL